MHNFEQFWMGTELSFEQLRKVMEVRATRDPQPQAVYGETVAASDKPALPYLLTISGNVGVVSISGPLTNTESPWNRYDGVVSYQEIRAALIHAATDPAIGAIVLDINSGGGAVSGVSDTADLIKQIDTKMKPVHSYSDGQMASAAYWLGSSARSVSVGKVTEAGSIGVLTVHQEISKMLENVGIGATVLRAGEFKAMGNRFEPLSDKAKGVIQAQLDSMYVMFVQHVADARSVSYAVADKQMGQGQVFMGEQAVTAGIVDKVTTFDAVVAKAQAGIDSKKNTPQYGANSTKGPAMKIALTEQQLAAAAELGAPAVERDPAEIAAAEKAVADQAAADKVAADKKVADEAAAPAGVVDFLKTSLAESQATVTALTIEVRDLKVASAKVEASHLPMRALVEASVDRLKVALGGTCGDYKAMSDEAVLAEHASLRASFEAKFKVGGVAAVATAAVPAEKEGAVDFVRAARIASTRSA